MVRINMNKSETIKLVGSELSCRKSCPLGYSCWGGYMEENLECEEGVGGVLKKLKNGQTEVLLMGANQFAVRVLDRTSGKIPLPEIVTIDIVEGNLVPR